MKILMVLTSHDQLGNTGKKTGLWLEEFCAPYYIFKDAGAHIVLASPKGGEPPVDPKSDGITTQSISTLRFKLDGEAKEQLATTERLADVSESDFDAAFYSGGHGPMWDLAEDRNSRKLIESFLAARKTVALVCHAPAALRHVETPDGAPLVSGRRVTGFTNTEEAAMELTDVVPFLLEDELKRLRGIYSKGEDMTEYVVEDGLLITGQNPKSSAAVAKLLIEKLA
ncbi:type 1 glutamine amidotransferase domain-containing protein [Tunturiibacter empetritectus]|uniref:Intracellular protease/amidase n=1 Tax=Tunturiibacter lichenicola TaxID=2051959 RepID=A0A852VLY2_9BACT|nr:type 1 glutamine amidotransferase domain-containing protein [Edaphobacter lichenicola]NYF91424.1 putative intracellular protease/amidase [Edaphobacter lichenicola]